METTARESAKAIRAYLTYQGENQQYRDKARVAAAAISSFARARSSETNRLSVELIAQRIGANILALPPVE
jgi:hypothetical protein